MSCPKTPHLLTEYFDESLSGVARAEIQRHLDICPDCASELADLQAVQQRLEDWQPRPVPHWDRGAGYRYQHQAGAAGRGGTWLWQWLPGAVSLAMLVLMVFNLQVTSSGEDFSVSFGGPGTGVSQAALAQFSADQERRQQEILQSFLARLEADRAEEHLLLTSTILDQTRQLTAESFELMATWVEQQHRLDMANLQAGYQQLLDSDMDTLLAMEQLASYVQFQEGDRQ